MMLYDNDGRGEERGEDRVEERGEGWGEGRGEVEKKERNYEGKEEVGNIVEIMRELGLWIGMGMRGDEEVNLGIKGSRWYGSWE